uniref:Putative trypsin-like peptidase domain containing protein n=1 Tax=viral metagenome TaxID=1070528 RepID=A0A6M3J8U9_9ZZZZ
MKRRCFWGIIALLVLIFIFNLPKDEPKSFLPLGNVVQIKCEVEYVAYYDEYCHPNGWQGSGIFIRDNLILTAGHIVDGIKEATVFTIDNKEYKAKSWYLETEADIGFIEVDTNDVETTLSFDDAKLGETVWTYGNPFGVFPLLTKGIISAVESPDDFMKTKDMIITDAAINAGNSGCPLFDERGNILGICSWGYRYSQGMSYFVRSEIIELSLWKYFAIKAIQNAN